MEIGGDYQRDGYAPISGNFRIGREGDTGEPKPVNFTFAEEQAAT